VITAGYYIGQLLDDLASIGTQVSNRNRVGLTDLSKLLENFYRDILNEVYAFNLANCNDERSNAPGIDLADEAQRVAVQVTSQRGSSKINDTLRVLSEDHIAKYSKIIILVAGLKQQSYPGLDQELLTRTNFMADNIWDYTDVCKRLINLPLDKLQALHAMVSKQVARVKIELEVPDENGIYPTGIELYAEAIPHERLSNLGKFSACVKADSDATDDDVRRFIETLVASLKRLPRITREVFAFMWIRRDEKIHSGGSIDRFRITDDKLRRLLSYKDLDGDLRLLTDEGMLTEYAPHETFEERAFFVLSLGSASKLLDESGHFYLDDFMTTNRISPTKVLVSLDFSDF